VDTMETGPTAPLIPGPAVVCVRGPSRSGKTAIVERLVAAFGARDIRAGYAKRTHHLLDLPEKASGRVWSRGPAAMALAAVDRIQVTLPPSSHDAGSVLSVLPGDLELIFLETHSPEDYPTIRSVLAEPVEAEAVIGTWSLPTIEEDVVAIVPRIERLLPADRRLARALRAAMQLHGGHACAGLILGTRLALHGADLLAIDVPDTEKRLLVSVETDRCAVDAVQAVTGCRPGKRTLRLLDYGKLAATFHDQRTGAAVRVAARGDLRDRVTPAGASREQRYEAQRAAYLALPAEDLFVAAPATPEYSQFDLPGPPSRRVTCDACGEEVSDGREVVTELGIRCRPCAARSGGS